MKLSASLSTSQLTDLYNASLQWTKCISRDQKHINCISKSHNRHKTDCGENSEDHVNNPTNLTADEFLSLIEKFKNSFKGEKKPISETQFSPYLDKYVIDKEASIHAIADLHGDIHTLLTHLNDLKTKGILDDNFKIIRDHHYLAFLGDCGDAGDSSCEVWALLMRLRIQNKDKCILVRGNHETGDLANKQGYGYELEKKFKLYEEIDKETGYSKKLNVHRAVMQQYYSFFNYLPAAVFFGYFDSTKDHITYTCLSHAGIELGWQDHEKFLNNTKKFSIALKWNRAAVIDNNLIIKEEVDKAFAQIDPNIKTEETRALEETDRELERGTPQQIGFMWNYYSANPHSHYEKSSLESRSSWKYGKTLTVEVLKSWSAHNKHNTWVNSLKKSINSLAKAYLGKRFFDVKTSYAVGFNVRGHQHVMPQNFVEKRAFAFDIQDMYLKPSGIFEQWENNAHIKSEWDITPYSVFTLKNAPCNIYGYPYALKNNKYLWYDNSGTRAHLSVKNNGLWKLQSINLPIFNKEELPADTQQNLVNLEEYLSLN